MPASRDPGAPPATLADDLDAQCRGIGTLAAPFAAPSARATYRTGPAVGAGILTDVPGARRGGGDSGCPDVRRA
jgi:hypothetical protein